jgi:hypothetical protein
MRETRAMNVRPFQPSRNAPADSGASAPPQPSAEAAANATMTRSEREDLQRLVRQREKVLKSAAKQRSAELIADFENQMGQEYAFDQDEVWEKATEAANREVQKAQKLVAARCRDLGIPDRFAPSLSLGWHHRGYDNLVEKRRIELRRMAATRVEAIEQKAIVEIELSCLEAQTQLAVAGLASDQARQFIEKLPSIETLMPRLAFAELAGEAEPPVAEQLISPNALRQQRYRVRQRALRDGNGALRNADNPADADVAEPLAAADDDGIPEFLGRPAS